MSLPIEITERLLDRVRLAAAFEGMSLDAFLERAVLASVHETEKRVSRNSELYRDAEEYPYKCDYCPRRFKLPMHRGRHVAWDHPEMIEKDEDLKQRVDVDPTVAEPVLASIPVEAEKEKFKLAPGIDAEMFEDFEKRFDADVPRLD